MPLFLFVLSPLLYYFVSYTKTNKRTDYPGKKISQVVQTQWDSNFSDKITIVVGSGWINGWYAQNLSYQTKFLEKSLPIRLRIFHQN